MSDIENTEDINEIPDLEVVAEKPAKKVTKKKAAKKPEAQIPCADCMSRNICKAQGWCKRG